jgi:hypothetical protein
LRDLGSLQAGEAIAKLSAASYHEKSARDARRRIVDFFETHLKP